MLATVVMATIAFVSLRNGVKDQKEEFIRKRKQITLEAYDYLQKEAFDHLNRYTPAEIREICEDNKSDEYRLLWGYVARIERFCLGLTSDVYDMDIFYSMSHGYFDNPKGILLQRILPVLERKMDRAREDYYKNIRKVWDMMDAYVEKDKRNSSL